VKRRRIRASLEPRSHLLDTLRALVAHVLEEGLPVLYELRTYEAAPGKLAALQARFRDHTMPLFERHGLQVVGFWTYAHGGWSNELVYMMAYEDMADRDAKWAAFGADPDWHRARTESESGGPLTTRIRSDLLRPTDYSPMQ
jgi:hypothetical protein